MKFRFLFSFIFLSLLLPFTARTQHYDITWGETNKASTKTGKSYEGIIMQNEGDLIALHANYALFASTIPPYIARYDASSLLLQESNPVFPKKYFTGGKESPTRLHEIIPAKNQPGVMTLFYSDYDKKNDKLSFYVQFYSLESGLGERTELQSVNASSGLTSGSYNMVLSEDSSQFLVIYLPQYKMYNNEKFTFYRYDMNFALLGDMEVELPLKNSQFSIEKTLLANDGQVYMLAFVELSKEEKKARDKKAPKYFYRILNFDLDTDSESLIANEFDMDLKDRFITGLDIKINGNSLICAGFYGNKNPNDINGTYYLTFDRESQEFSEPSVYEFDKKFIEEFYSVKAAEKAEKKGKELEVPEIVLRDIIIKKDGSILLVGEQYYTVTICYTDSKGNVRCRTYYYYNDILVTQVDPEGAIEWVSKIPKKSVTTGATQYQGFDLICKDEELYFFFSDHVKNLDQQDPREFQYLSNYWSSATVAVKMDEDGKTTKETLFIAKDLKMIYSPQGTRTVVSGPAELIMHISKKNNYKLGKVVF